MHLYNRSLNKGLVPPARAFKQRRAHGLRRSWIQVVNDRFDRLADFRLRVYLLQAVTTREIDHQWGTYLCRIVCKSLAVIAQPDDARTRLVGKRLVVVVRKTNKGMMHMHRHRRIVRRYGRQVGPGRFTKQRHNGFNFGVVGKGFGARQVDRRTRRVYGKLTFIPRSKPVRNAMRIAQEEIGAIDDNGVAIAGQ